ncbi:tRNA uridine-5-carboxymethylaminomethyl(34) synthesis GTPase MnmE [Peptoniphilus equinus]|uniref:tRNA modification GTPase MnmE n=1 Tax=Peptoniphilus equinus TaxID=3016343 RepID=A0ABY7QVP2_9FIRM|nr:tRNA uridine-5-carboxymethylaminomethyl(34) synthesis GTPase MnmE [Peptoniphilus equinus]WBW49978.1 tRNA uridine-5-carboxymethylaminomethyl(34) synthesis GTPase MnmE [Peptoniphilus equinus]
MNDTIAAISTATGEAGIGIVRMSGPESVVIADTLFAPISKSAFAGAANRTMVYGHIYDDGRLIDEVLVCKMLGPHSYTREDIVEIYCHGGIIAVRKILEALLHHGARLAERGEFTKRAFLNGRLDLSQAEAVIDLIHSKSDRAYEMSMAQLEGRLSGQIKMIKDKLIDMSSLVVANIDFPEDEVDEANYDRLQSEAEAVIGDLDRLLDNANRGVLLREGIETVILGKPNVGKSTLLNAMLRQQRAIVTDIPGTTRDTISDYVNLNGIVLKLTDTAGIRNTEDVVERMGVERAKSLVDKSDLIIAIFDLSRPLEDDDRDILQLIQDKKHIVVLNKSDAVQNEDDEDLAVFLQGEDSIRLSILKDGADPIEDRILELFFEGHLNESDYYVNNLRHIEALKAARSSMDAALKDIEMKMFMDLLQVNLDEALLNISEITGETTTEDVLDVVFSKFCIGK